MENDTIIDNEQNAIKKYAVYGENSCPVRITMKVIGGKWKLILIHIINNESPARFGDLRRKAEGITQSMLTSVLRELEEDGIVHRKIYAEIPPKVEYTLTDLGKSLLPIVSYMRDWGLVEKARNKNV